MNYRDPFPVDATPAPASPSLDARLTALRDATSAMVKVECQVNCQPHERFRVTVRMGDEHRTFHGGTVEAAVDIAAGNVGLYLSDQLDKAKETADKLAKHLGALNGGA